MKCYFCKKRLWFWQDTALVEYHRKCYFTYVVKVLADAKKENIILYDLMRKEVHQLGDLYPREVNEIL